MLELKQKFSFSQFHENWRIFAKIFVFTLSRKLEHFCEHFSENLFFEIAENLMKRSTWGIQHKITKLGIFEHYLTQNCD
jgi:hypothetical protein